MNPFGNLSDENKEQIIKYLTFLRSKKESVVRSVRNDFEDSISNLSEDVYSKNDVVELIEFIESQTNVNYSSSFPSYFHRFSLILSLI